MSLRVVQVIVFILVGFLCQLVNAGNGARFTLPVSRLIDRAEEMRDHVGEGSSFYQTAVEVHRSMVDRAMADQGNLVALDDFIRQTWIAMPNNVSYYFDANSGDVVLARSDKIASVKSGHWQDSVENVSFRIAAKAGSELGLWKPIAQVEPTLIRVRPDGQPSSPTLRVWLPFNTARIDFNYRYAPENQPQTRVSSTVQFNLENPTTSFDIVALTIARLEKPYVRFGSAILYEQKNLIGEGGFTPVRRIQIRHSAPRMSSTSIISRLNQAINQGLDLLPASMRPRRRVFIPQIVFFSGLLRFDMGNRTNIVLPNALEITSSDEIMKRTMRSIKPLSVASTPSEKIDSTRSIFEIMTALAGEQETDMFFHAIGESARLFMNGVR